MKVQLIIKGTPMWASRAASLRGIPLLEIKAHPRFDEIIAICPDYYYDKAVKWFCEPTSGAPYKTGTLLWYSMPKPFE
jgi:hypothetical protein